MDVFEGLSILDIFLSVVGLVLTILITYRQNKISKNQSDLLTALHTDEATEKQVEAFFKISKNHKGYSCIYPYETSSRVIPSLRIGDTYTILILERLLSKHKLKKRGVIRKGKMNCESDYKENCIIICTCLLQQENKTPFPIIAETEEEITNITSKSIPLNDFPCWFVRGKRTINNKQQDATGILIPNEPALVSGADSLYLDLDKTQTSCLVNDEQETHDYGIISRIKTNDKDYILLAGIHSIGTWVAVHFLDHFLRNKSFIDENIKEHIYGDSDFILLVDGTFSTQELRVTESHKSRFWWREANKNDGVWTRVG